MGSHGRKYGVIYFSFVLMGLLMALHFWMGWKVAVQEAATHDETAALRDYVWVWGRDTIENWQSEIGQVGYQFWLLSAGIGVAAATVWPKLRSYLTVYEEDQESMKQAIQRIEEKVDRLAERS